MSSAVLPRSSGKKPGPKLSKSSEESCKKKSKTVASSSARSFSGKSRDELHATGSHPWSGVAEKLLAPLPADWRYNIQKAFSDMGEALGKMLGGGGGNGPRFRRF